MPEETTGEIPIALVQGNVRPGTSTAKALPLVADDLMSIDFQEDISDPIGVALPMTGSDVVWP